jgi:peptidoglycan/LPS O-acetylase OafA/YrhL
VYAIVAEKLPTAGSTVRIVTAFAVSIAVTLFSWFVVEQRFLRRKIRVAEGV